MVIEVRPLPPEERKKFSELVVGMVTCPNCDRTDVKVVSDDGAKADPQWLYLENHYDSENSKNLCQGSEKILRALKVFTA